MAAENKVLSLCPCRDYVFNQIGFAFFNLLNDRFRPLSGIMFSIKKKKIC